MAWFSRKGLVRGNFEFFCKGTVLELFIVCDSCDGGIHAESRLDADCHKVKDIGQVMKDAQLSVLHPVRQPQAWNQIPQYCEYGGNQDHVVEILLDRDAVEHEIACRQTQKKDNFQTQKNRE